MKSGSNYKMTKESKRLLGTVVDKIYRSDFKKAVINADLSASRIVRSAKSPKENSGE